MTPDDDALRQLTPAEQADYWLTLLDSPLAGDDERQAFQIWLESEPAHRRAWQKAQAFWQHLDGINDDQVAEIERSLAQRTSTVPISNVVDIKADTTPKFAQKLMPVAASLLLAAMLNFAVVNGYFADYRTTTAEQRLVRLEDGSTVLLNTNSSLSVDYAADARTVSLSGEAYFSVTGNPDRPFTVHTAGGEVRALGTAFDVKQIGDDLTITVYEHAVRVALKQGETVERLQEGQRVSSHGGHVDALESVNLRQTAAWQRRQLVFAGQPLAQVVEELNRYRKGRIVIFGQDLAEHRVTGVFDTHEPEQALATIENILGLQEWRFGDALVILRRPK
ncbi:FecR family protein [Methylomonas methanica]|uniref:Anti-FecI sigma factor, FecR n=1 Tax=Methylomonas methanica (strain DSM 25384 / MC09) TaxID=857087 RepID=G0A110_METMM|nr:FecR family protein [Methylomonas methanica]AEG01266.1 anti-FecI sigma factor, FecR [Methylomonas methanica MC09]